VSVLSGLRAAFAGTTLDHVAGVPILGGDLSGIAAAVEAARRADHVILCLGEAAAMSGEAASRARIDLPGHQAALADAILAVGKPVIVLLFSGRPIAMSDVFDRAAAVVACWFPGTVAGQAVADVLAGRMNPSGKLAVTWPRHVGQVPIFYAERPTGRPMNPVDKYTSKYLDMPNDPEFPFGHGLSYTTFGLTEPTVTTGETIAVETTVSNDGARAGRTTVFLFIRDPVASLSRPVLELKRFETVELAAGERRVVRFSLTRDDFAFLDSNLEPLVEPGEIEIHVGLSADRSEIRSAKLRIDVPPLRR
jgi:beta-glucosidase